MRKMIIVKIMKRRDGMEEMKEEGKREKMAFTIYTQRGRKQCIKHENHIKKRNKSRIKQRNYKEKGRKYLRRSWGKMGVDALEKKTKDGCREMGEKGSAQLLMSLTRFGS